MSSRRVVRELARVATAAGMLAVVAGLASAQEVKSGPRVAVVDIQAVNASFVQLTAKRDDLQQWAQQQEAYIKDLQGNYLYLAEGPFNEIVDILRLPRPLGAKAAKRQREIKELSAQKEDRFLELQAKVNRTPQEQEEFNGLQELADARNKQLAAMADDLHRQFEERKKQAEDALNTALQAVVKEIAAAQKFDLVLDKRWVLFGGEDITQAVIDKLNAQAPKPAAPPAAPPGPALPGVPPLGGH